mmetsp:Transcript_24288/g.46121  ORF Transcript_24288/g.46121 Transcript_24288/m.46121 type:complete len:139 (+) Transcript_24288:960-1376(+)
MHQAQWRLCANEPPRLVSTKSVHPSPRTRGKTVIGPSLHRRAGNFNAFEPFVSLPLRTKYEVGARVGFCRRFEDRLYGDFKARVHFFETGRYVVWGLTSAILIDVARFALGREPDFHAQCDSLSKVMRRGRSQCTQSF